MNFDLFKKRGFGDYISDTFGFFRHTGKHYINNYFTISGFSLLILVALSYFLSNVYLEFFMRIEDGRDNSNIEYLQGYLLNNLPLAMLIGLFIFLFMIFISLLNYSIPVIYLDLYEKNRGNSFGAKEIFAKFKSKFGRILIFFLGTLFIITPILMVIFTILFLLCMILIGIPLLLFAIPTSFSWLTLSFFEYLNTDKGLFKCYGAGLKHLKNQYFPIVGSTMIIYTIIQVTMMIFTMIPYVIGIVSMITQIDERGTTNNAFSTLRIMMTIVMVFSILTSFILNNLLMINQGLVYYSRKEHDENKSADFSIDLIGSE